VTAFNHADLFELQVDAVPERTALIVDGVTRRTYAELEVRANRLANHLASVGVARGDHVGIHAYNGHEWVEGLFAAYKLGATPVNINYRYVEDELRYVYSNADLVAVIVQREFAPLVAAIRDDVPTLRHVLVSDDGSGAALEGLDAHDYEAALAAASPTRDFEPRSGDDIHLLYTGGTTGMPKGVMWRHEDLFFALCGGIDPYSGERLQRPEELAERSRAATDSGGAGMVILPAPPLMHGAGQMGTIRSLLAGDTVVLVSKFDAAKIWELVDAEHINVISITGDAMARPLADELERRQGELDTSSVVSFSSSAAIWSPSVKQQVARLLPNALLTDAIGASESGMNGIRIAGGEDESASTGPPTVTASPDTVVLDEDTMRPLRPGDGRIGKLARTGNVPLGYYQDPEKTAATFPTIDGVRYSVPGDYARLEADGQITLLGRGSQSINTGGEKVFPEEVEGELKAHPSVQDALVVGLPDERWGERVTAVVQVRGGHTPTLEELDAHCRGRLAGYKIPRVLVITDQMPRLESGKPDYPAAKELAEKSISG
jgi:acyl-CoA synthetase (AMP-forming)/AMP-acid ligase II